MIKETGHATRLANLEKAQKGGRASANFSAELYAHTMASDMVTLLGDNWKCLMQPVSLHQYRCVVPGQ